MNSDKREFLHPHKFGDGLKLMEFSMSAPGTMTGLALLLASSNGPDGRGGGDWHPWLGGPGYEGREVPDDPARCAEVAKLVPGRWAGDRITVVGDYAEIGDQGVGTFKDVEQDGQDVPDTPFTNEQGWTDISDLVLEALRMDYYARQQLPEPVGDGWRQKAGEA